nr:CAZy families GT11 protein [uncultured Bacteroides sp.]
MDKERDLVDGQELDIWKKNYKVYWGGWMSENYFRSVELEVRDSFTFDLNKLSEKSRELLNELYFCDRESVSIHVRRGDYLQSTQYRDICGEAY